MFEPPNVLFALPQESSNPLFSLMSGKAFVLKLIYNVGLEDSYSSRAVLPHSLQFSFSGASISQQPAAIKGGLFSLNAEICSLNQHSTGNENI